MRPDHESTGRIVGSAEPLSPVETRRRLAELRAWGVNLSPVEASLRMTPHERLAQMLAWLRTIEALRTAYPHPHHASFLLGRPVNKAGERPQ
jgi:hypothetical protein